MTEPAAQSVRDLQIHNITEDSRLITPGSLFIARAGTKLDGKQFVASAVEAGACAVLTDDPTLTARVPVIIVHDIALATAHLADTFFGSPTRAMHLAGVTGTNGKTTISWLVYSLLRSLRVQANSIGCGLIGTVAIDEGQGLREANMTTPPALHIAKMFASMRDHHYTAASMEVSSHALHQKRVDALRFAAAIFTNLTGDHLDYHGTMEHYADAKARLFELLADGGTAILNVSGAWHERMQQACAEQIAAGKSIRVLRVAAMDEQSTCKSELDARIVLHAQSLAGIDATIFAPFGPATRVRVPLVGTYNAVNVLQAMLAAHAIAVRCGMESSLAWHKLLAEVSSLTAPPGRLERVTSVQAPFGVFVDYAHSDDSLRNVLQAVRACMPARATLTCVFGCGGDRDRTKRPRMGLAAAELADRVVLTSDNPRTENPQAIMREVLAGVPASMQAKVHSDEHRASAIAYAIDHAREGDVVVIAGKGHETYQILPDGKGGTIRTNFDDRVVARAALAARGIRVLESSVSLTAHEVELKPSTASLTA
jgi:UDP-N-acetylmuramoyl-L-alanyl-D-glutamate--2,6-diaminopimelate ligase